WQAISSGFGTSLPVFTAPGPVLFASSDTETRLSEGFFDPRTFEILRHVAEGPIHRGSFAGFQPRRRKDGVDDRGSARLQHACNFGQTYLQVRNDLEHVAAPDDIDAAIELVGLFHHTAADLDPLIEICSDDGGPCP